MNACDFDESPGSDLDADDDARFPIAVERGRNLVFVNLDPSAPGYRIPFVHPELDHTALERQ